MSEKRGNRLLFGGVGTRGGRGGGDGDRGLGDAPREDELVHGAQVAVRDERGVVAPLAVGEGQRAVGVHGRDEDRVELLWLLRGGLM
mgnify:CR=1 FL=1